MISGAWDLRQGKNLKSAANTAAGATDADFVKQAAANPLANVQKAKADDAKKNGQAPAEQAKSKWQKAGSTTATLGKLGAKAGYAVANKVVPVAVAGAVTAAAGPVAGCAAGLCTAAAMGAAHGAVSSARKGESAGKILQSAAAKGTQQAASWIPGGQAIRYGVHSAGNSLADGKPIGAALQNGLAGVFMFKTPHFSFPATTAYSSNAPQKAMTDAMVMDTVQTSINGVGNTLKGSPPLSANGKKLQATGKDAGKMASVVGALKGNVAAKNVDSGRADASAKKHLATAQAAAKGNAHAATAASNKEYDRVQQAVKGSGPSGGVKFETPEALKQGAKHNLQFKTPEFKTPDRAKEKGGGTQAAPAAGAGAGRKPGVTKSFGRSPPAHKQNAPSAAAQQAWKSAGTKAGAAADDVAKMKPAPFATASTAARSRGLPPPPTSPKTSAGVDLGSAKKGLSRFPPATNGNAGGVAAREKLRGAGNTAAKTSAAVGAMKSTTTDAKSKGGKAPATPPSAASGRGKAASAPGGTKAVGGNAKTAVAGSGKTKPGIAAQSKKPAAHTTPPASTSKALTPTAATKKSAAAVTAPSKRVTPAKPVAASKPATAALPAGKPQKPAAAAAAFPASTSSRGVASRTVKPGAAAAAKPPGPRGAAAAKTRNAQALAKPAAPAKPVTPAKSPAKPATVAATAKPAAAAPAKRGKK
ncbi:hypothetical protein DFJ73DRAFT_756845 [Zopfochytrium polystomum]|nr:hypothetical protein DFJ73DRAFT_756845 [Zopfochytrium polystomum]